MQETVEEILEACRSMRDVDHAGEPVDEYHHALQCAALARTRSGDRAFVVAALLHDIARAPSIPVEHGDAPHAHHGQAAAAWLEPRVGGRIAWLVEQHVAAKRYLVATDPSYSARLTVASARTLMDQGGPMTAEEVNAFMANPDWCLALELREIDDHAKVPGAVVPGIEAYYEDIAWAVAARPPRPMPLLEHPRGARRGRYVRGAATALRDRWLQAGS